MKSLLFILSFFSTPSWATGLCGKYLEGSNYSYHVDHLFDRDLGYYRINSPDLVNLPSFKKSTKGFLDVITFKKVRKTISLLEIGTNDDVFIGFLENGHVYLIINGERLDGEALYISPKFRKSGFLTEGFVIKFKNPGSEITQGLSDYIGANGKPKSLTCSSGICEAINSTLKLKDQNGHFYSTLFPSLLFQQIISHKLYYSSGINPDIEVYILGDKSPKELLSNIKKSEKTRPTPFVLGAAALLLSTIYFGF